MSTEPPISGLRPHGAGEGGRLPKGLSLFRFFLFGGLLLGGAFGALSLYCSPLPVQGYRSKDSVPAAQWSPSPVWFPVFVSIHARLGVTKTPLGYSYRGALGRALHGSAVLFIAMLMGGALGWISGEQARRYIINRRRKYTAKRAENALRT